MKINNQNKKRYMLLLFAMIVMLLVFKIIYIRREYIDLNTDYSVYVVMFMPFAIFYALKYMDNITSVPALNWICTVPMSMYLYQSRYLRFKQLVMKNGRRFYISSRNVTEVKKDLRNLMRKDMIKKYLNILFYMFSFIFIYYLLVSGTNYEILPSLLIMIIIFIDIVMYVADEYESSIITERQKSAVYLKDLENQRENVEAIEQRNLETERRNHDLKKNVRLIKDLIENNRYDEAREYVCKLEEKCSTYFSYRLYSKHSVINSLLNSKLEFCQSNGIDVKCFVCGK